MKKLIINGKEEIPGKKVRLHDILSGQEIDKIIDQKRKELEELKNEQLEADSE